MTEGLLKKLICAAIESFPIDPKKKEELRRRLMERGKEEDHER